MSTSTYTNRGECAESYVGMGGREDMLVVVAGPLAIVPLCHRICGDTECEGAQIPTVPLSWRAYLTISTQLKVEHMLRLL